MEISKYIIQILKEQEQVIVPGLGSFVAEYKSAKIHPIDHNFTPPIKEIVFDNFTPDDDFLIRKIAESENVTQEKAILEIRNFTDNLITEIQTYKVSSIKGLGTFTLNIDNTITFTAEKIDISDESFGLDEYKSPAVIRNDFKEKAKEIKKAKEDEAAKKARNKRYILVSLSVIIFTALVFLVFFTDIFRNIIYDTDVKMERPNSQMSIQQNSVAEQVMTDTAVNDTLTETQISENENPTTDAVVEKKQDEPKPKTEPKPEVVKEKIKETTKYYIVAGSFKIQENAEKRVEELKSKSYNGAGYLQPNNKGLYVVYYKYYNSKQDAEVMHQKVMKEENPESWVMKK